MAFDVQSWVTPGGQNIPTAYYIVDLQTGAKTEVSPGILNKLYRGGEIRNIHSRVIGYLNLQNEPNPYHTPPTPTPPPTPSPHEVESNIYQFHIKTSTSPELSAQFIERMRATLIKGGWGLNNIYRTGEGYILELEKVGSATLIIIAVVIAALLAVLKIYIISIIVEKITGGVVATTQSNNIKNSTNEVLKFCQDNGLSSVECQELMDSVKNTYEVDPPSIPEAAPSPTSQLLGFDIQPILWALVAIQLIGAFSK